MLRMMIASCVLFLSGSVLSAAIIYEPVQSQYGYEPRYYYGGSNPLNFAQGERLHCFYNKGYGYEGSVPSYSTSREGRYGENLLHFGLIGQAPYVFSDCLPAGVNASVYGFTATDARNEAYMNVPRYFVKRDLVRAGVPDGAGNLVVPAQARPETIDIHPYVRPAPTTMPEPIMIIPKRLLNKPLKPADKSVADAR
jgi:hypothetical protein